MEWPVILALTLTIPLMLFPAGLAWYMVAGCGYRVLRRGAKKAICSVNADCPPGYTCVDGECNPSA